MKRKCLSLLAALCLALCLAAPALATEAAAPPLDATAPFCTADNGQPYYIMVNRSLNVITVYAVGEDGRYSLPVKAMPCSVGAAGSGLTPTGTFTLPGARYTWLLMFKDVYTQYATRITDHVLFHSIPYAVKSPDTMLTKQYNKLGSPASMGCIRLQFSDAKWIYDNCRAGTLVTIYDDPSSPGPLGKPQPMRTSLGGGAKSRWDPTDSRRENPWYGQVVLDVTLSESELTLDPGQTHALTAAVSPAGATIPSGAYWHSSDPAVVSVDKRGNLTAHQVGTARVACCYGTLFAWCQVTVEPPYWDAYAVTRTVKIDGEEVSFQMYALLDESGDPTNYVRARDIAIALMGTQAQFDVGYVDRVYMATGYPYYRVNEEDAVPFSDDRPCQKLKQKTSVDGVLMALEGIVLTDDQGGGYTYFKLRDLGQALGFQVDWDPQEGILVTTGGPAEPAAPEIPSESPAEPAVSEVPSETPPEGEAPSQAGAEAPPAEGEPAPEGAGM